MCARLIIPPIHNTHEAYPKLGNNRLLTKFDVIIEVIKPLIDSKEKKCKINISLRKKTII